MTSFARGAWALRVFHLGSSKKIYNLLSGNEFLQDAPATTSDEIATLTAAVRPRVRASAGGTCRPCDTWKLFQVSPFLHRDPNAIF
jgi:hypothetical protein